MLARLPGPLHTTLEIREPLRASNLQKTVFNLVNLYHSNFEMGFPPLNFPLLIYKHMRNLGLPSKSEYLYVHFLI
jgi:RNA polymerase I-specific transcription initiation factor RRN7